MQTIVLPRQARDEHRETTQKKDCFDHTCEEVKRSVVSGDMST
jgi:hypothetical protein